MRRTVLVPVLVPWSELVRRLTLRVDVLDGGRAIVSTASIELLRMRRELGGPWRIPVALAGRDGALDLVGPAMPAPRPIATNRIWQR